MIKLIKYLGKKEYLLAIISVILIYTGVWLELKMPDYMSKITVLVQTEGSKMSEIIKSGLYMLLCAFGSLLTSVFVCLIMARISAKFSLNVRRKIFEHVLKLSTNEVKSLNTSSLITRTTNDVTQIEMLIAMGLQLMIKSPITAIWAIRKILDKSIEWSMLTGFAVIILLITVITLMIIVVPKFKIIQKLTDSLNGVTRENLSGIRVVRAFNAENYSEDKFDSVNSELTKRQLFNQRAFAIMSPVMYLVLYFLTLSIYFVGAYLIDAADITNKLSIFGDMVVFSSYAMQVIISFLMLAMIFMILPRASVSAKRINEVLNKESSIKDGNIEDGISNLVGTVEFKGVSFKYPDAEEELLTDISFTANRGETVAIIGSTGSGKSSLINLITRFYDATKGSVLIDGVDVKDYKLENLYNKIGYVQQKAVMFNGTVLSNVAYGFNGYEKTVDVINKALDIAQASEFVNNMEDGINSHISSGGTNVSGGQKQRLSIARAIARNPEIYIFDDSFSALDYKTDSILRSELKKYTCDATTIIVAQRIGTVLNADKIIVLENGKVVGIGTHKELLEECDVYKQIALSQLSWEELNNA